MIVNISKSWLKTYDVEINESYGGGGVLCACPSRRKIVIVETIFNCIKKEIIWRNRLIYDISFKLDIYKF